MRFPRRLDGVRIPRPIFFALAMMGLASLFFAVFALFGYTPDRAAYLLVIGLAAVGGWLNGRRYVSTVVDSGPGWWLVRIARRGVAPPEATAPADERGD